MTLIETINRIKNNDDAFDLIQEYFKIKESEMLKSLGVTNYDELTGIGQSIFHARTAGALKGDISAAVLFIKFQLHQNTQQR